MPLIPDSLRATSLGRKLVAVAAIATGVGVVAVASLFYGQPQTASAHCDSTTGPVVTAAKSALEGGDVNLILPYVKPDQEAELKAAFKQALDVRAAGGDAQTLADRYFSETAVRLHRQGEGASYTGLKEGVEMEPALAAAEHALESGDLSEVYKTLDEEIRHGVGAHYTAVLEAREAEAKKHTVENARARVEAEFSFEKYVLGISEAAKAAAHDEAAASAPANGHGHE